jgi:hypothetical protein
MFKNVLLKKIQKCQYHYFIKYMEANKINPREAAHGRNLDLRIFHGWIPEDCNTTESGRSSALWTMNRKEGQHLGG